MKFLIATAVLALAARVSAYANGAATCVADMDNSSSMGMRERKSEAGQYSVVPGSSAYSPGSTMGITIKGGPFKGYVIYAENGNGDRVGAWSGAGVGHGPYAPADCKDKTDWATHKDGGDKTDLTLTFTAPDSDIGDIKIVSLVYDADGLFGTFWKPEQVTMSASEAAPTDSPDAASPTNAPATDPTEAPAPNPTDAAEPTNSKDLEGNDSGAGSMVASLGLVAALVAVAHVLAM